MVRSSVDFPEPLAPMTATAVPPTTSRDTSVRATLLPCCTRRSMARRRTGSGTARSVTETGPVPICGNPQHPGYGHRWKRELFSLFASSWEPPMRHTPLRALLIPLAAGLVLAACGSDTEADGVAATDATAGASTQPGADVTIAVTTTVLGDVVTDLVGDLAEVVTIMPAGAERPRLPGLRPAGRRAGRRRRHRGQRGWLRGGPAVVIEACGGRRRAGASTPCRCSRVTTPTIRRGRTRGRGRPRSRGRRRSRRRGRPRPRGRR